MMIRINLLPVRQVKKREMGRQVLVLYVVLIVGALLGNYLWYANRDNELTNKRTQSADLSRRIAELEKVIGEVNNINKRKKDVQDKLKVLDDLRKGRSGPVRMLDALALSTPKKVYVKSFDENASQVRLSGTANSHDDVADFMRSMANIVWTPRGMGRLVERRRDNKGARVELVEGQGAVEDFPSADVGTFFTNIDLKHADSKDSKDGRVVDFEINLTANYAI